MSFGGILSFPEIEPGKSYSEDLYLPLWVRFEHPGEYVVEGARLIELLDRPEWGKPILTNSFAAHFKLKVLPTNSAFLGERIEKLGKLLDSTGAPKPAQELADINDARVVPYLLRAVEEERGDAMAYAVSGLGNHPSPEVTHALIKALHYQRDSSIRTCAAGALGNMKNREAEDALIGALDEPNGHVRAQVAISLGKIGGDEAINALESHLPDADMYVRLAYVEQLANLGVPFHKEWVVPIIKSEQLNEFQNAVWFVRNNAGSNAPMILAGCLDTNNPAITNYYNHTLVWQIGICGGPRHTYNHDFHGKGTPTELDENRKTLASLSEWVHSLQSAK